MISPSRQRGVLAHQIEVLLTRRARSPRLLPPKKYSSPARQPTSCKDCQRAANTVPIAPKFRAFVQSGFNEVALTTTIRSTPRHATSQNPPDSQISVSMIQDCLSRGGRIGARRFEQSGMRDSFTIVTA